MPVYCYSTAEGEIIEHFQFTLDPPDTITGEDGTVAYRDYQAEHGSRKWQQGIPWSEPLHSLSLGVNPKQIPEAEKKMAALGCPTKYHPVTGDMLITDRQHRNKVMKISGVRDNDAGYGDWAGEH